MGRWSMVSSCLPLTSLVHVWSLSRLSWGWVAACGSSFVTHHGWEGENWTQILSPIDDIHAYVMMWLDGIGCDWICGWMYNGMVWFGMPWCDTGPWHLHILRPGTSGFEASDFWWKCLETGPLLPLWNRKPMGWVGHGIKSLDVTMLNKPSN